MSVEGRIHSIQSMGTLDGPGVRFVVFFQGCNLRCKCCHNPDTWDFSGGQVCTAKEIVDKAVRYKEYFGKDGGITLSGGEPLLQAEFAKEIFELCKKEGIDTCLDTSGSVLSRAVKDLLSKTNRVLLDIKYTENSIYKENVGCTLDSVLEFLEYLNLQNIPTVLRQVIIPTVNDSKANISALNSVAKKHPCVEKIELLPFKKICQTKYDSLGIEFPFANLPEPTAEDMNGLKQLININ